MYKLLGGLKDYLKWQDITTDCAIFRLHTLFTTVLLMAGSIVITASQFVGNPIQCIVNGLPTHVVNTFCWISSTFTMPDAFKRQVSDWFFCARGGCIYMVWGVFAGWHGGGASRRGE